MVDVIEVVPPHNPGTDVPVDPNAGKVVLSKEEHDDLVHRATVSSQNFERAKKAESKIEELTTEIANLSDQVPSEFRDERVSALQTEIADIRQEQAVTKVQEKFPQLKEVWSDFESFRADPDNKGMNLNTAAKAFLAEKGLTPVQPRKGLENPTGGDRTPISSGMTTDEIKTLRETDYKKYAEMLRKGQIKVS